MKLQILQIIDNGNGKRNYLNDSVKSFNEKVNIHILRFSNKAKGEFPKIKVLQLLKHAH